MISGILIVMAIAVIMAFFVVVAMTITSVTCGYERDRKREAEVSPREFWLLLSLLVGGILIILVLFITLIWSFFV